MAGTKVKLGKAVKDEGGVLHGRISGLGIGSVDFITEEATSLDGTQYLKMKADPTGDNYEIGALFPKEKDGMKYYSASLESPLLPAPINAALFPDKNNENSFNLVWNRQEPKAAAEVTAEATADAGQDKTKDASQQKRGMFRRSPAAAPN